MISLKDRLRDVIGVRSGGPSGPPDEDDGARSGRPPGLHHDSNDPAEVLDGAWQEAAGHRFVVVERKYPPGHRHGDVTVADGLPPSDGAWPALDLLARTSCRDRLLFVDLETTGLAGGAGTYAFLVGCAWFDGGSFRIRQYLMSNPMV